ncbi:hypothetical protein ACTA71_007176 [Dictyostelium dimigraforme]
MDIIFFKVFKNKYINKKIWSFVKRYDETSKRYDEIISISKLLSLYKNNKNKIIPTEQKESYSLIELFKYKIKKGDIILFDFNIQQIIQVLSKNEQIKDDRDFFRCLVTYYKEELIFTPFLLESFCKYGNLIALEEITNLENINSNNFNNNNNNNNYNNKINKNIYYENYKTSKKAFDLAIEVGEFKIMDFLFKNRNEGYTERDILENIFLNSNSMKMCSVFLNYALKTMSIDLSKCKAIDIDCYYHLQDDLEIANKLYELDLINFHGISYLYHHIPFPILNTPIELLNIIRSFLLILKRYIYKEEKEKEKEEEEEEEEEEKEEEDNDDEYPIPERPPIELIEEFINIKNLFTNKELEMNIILDFKENDKRIEKLIHWYIVLFEPYGLFSESVDLIYSFIAKYSDTIEDKQLVDRVLNNSNDWDNNLIFINIFLNCNFNLLNSFFDHFKIIKNHNNNNNNDIKDGIKDGISYFFESNSNEKVIQFLQSFFNNNNNNIINNNLKNEILIIIYQYLKLKSNLLLFSKLLQLLPTELKDDDYLLFNNEKSIIINLENINNINNNNEIIQIPIPTIIQQSISEEQPIIIIIKNDEKVDPIMLIKFQRFEELFENYFINYDDATKTLLENELLYIEIGKRCVQPDELLDKFIKVLIDFNVLENSKELIFNSLLKTSIENGYLKNLQYFFTNDNITLFNISNEIIIKLLLHSIINDNITIVSYLFSILFPFLFFNSPSQTILKIDKKESSSSSSSLLLSNIKEKLKTIKLSSKMEKYLNEIFKL